MHAPRALFLPYACPARLVSATCMPRAPCFCHMHAPRACFCHMRLFFREMDLFVGAILLDRCRWALRPRQTDGDTAPYNPRWRRPGRPRSFQARSCSVLPQRTHLSACLPTCLFASPPACLPPQLILNRSCSWRSCGSSSKARGTSPRKNATTSTVCRTSGGHSRKRYA